MKENKNLASELLDCERRSAGGNPDNFIANINEAIAKEKKRQAMWDRVTRYCLIALGSIVLLLTGMTLFGGVSDGLVNHASSMASHPATGPGTDDSPQITEAGDNTRRATVIQLGWYDTFLPVLLILLPALVFAIPVLLIARWLSTRSVRNAVIEKQLASLSQQVEQIQALSPK